MSEEEALEALEVLVEEDGVELGGMVVEAGRVLGADDEGGLELDWATVRVKRRRRAKAWVVGAMMRLVW